MMPATNTMPNQATRADQAEARTGVSQAGRGLRLVTISGALMTLGYMGYFLLLQAHSLWASPTLVPDKWKSVYYPFIALFPTSWVRANKQSGFALLNSGLYILL